MHRYCLYLLIVALLAWQDGDARELRLALPSGKPPYVYIEQGQWHGFEYELTRLALERLGHQVSVEDVPHNRLDYALRALQFDAATPLLSDGPEDEGIHFSAPFMRYENVAISKQADGYHIARIADLAPYRVLTWRNAINHLGPEFKGIYNDAFRQGDASRYREFSDQADQYRQFWASPGSVIIIEKRIFRWHLNRDRLRAAREPQLAIHHPFPANVYRVGFRDAALRDAFDRELTKLQASGEYQAAIDRYLEP
ncbi:MAG: ABC transporter substrate-binding protein [Gammaproteobacteria bacterium]|nr:ABC transporter substrate-binding protein [Gammaproteobacteria bacterium]